MRGTIPAILAAWALLAGIGGASEPAPIGAVLPEASKSDAGEPESHEAETWKPETPHVIAEEGEELPAWPRLHFRAEYLLWWFKDMPLPPVLTAGLTTDVNPGALDQPGTVTIFGGKNLYEQRQAGTRGAVTYWLDPDECFAVEGTGFFLASRSVILDRPKSTGPKISVLGQPFFNLATGQEDVSLVLFPGVVAGFAHVAVTTRLWGAEANGLANLFRWRGLRVDALAGFRSFQFFESVTMGEQATVSASVPGIGGSVTAGVDNFGVTNNFYGGQVGLRTEVRNGRLFLELQGKAACGATQEVLNIAGQTTILQPGLPVRTLPGNLFALSSNIGSHGQTSFAFLPEANVNIGWQALEHLQFQVGYSFLYLSRVARAGAQIDRGLNPNLIPSSLSYGLPAGPARPTVTALQESDFWVQGFNFGLELTF